MEEDLEFSASASILNSQHHANSIPGRLTENIDRNQILETQNSQLLNVEEVSEDDVTNMLSKSERSLENGGKLGWPSNDQKHRQAAKLKKLKDIGRRKQARLMKENLKR